MIQLFPILLVGISLGILVGLSVTPVVSTVLSAILSLITASLTILIGLEYNKPGRSISAKPWPLAILMVGLVCGTFSGILLRTYRVFAPRPSKVIADWVALGIKQPIAAQRLFDLAYPALSSEGGSPPKKDASAPPSTSKVDPTGPYVYGERVGTCDALTNTSDPDELLALLERENSKYWLTVTRLLKSQPKKTWVESIAGICDTRSLP